MNSNALPISWLPPDDALRAPLHNEVHARPSARVRLPALIVYVAVLNAGISREQECEHLRQLPGQQDLLLAQLQGNFLRLRFEGYTLKWERHTEFTRYSIVQCLPEAACLGACEPELLSHPVVGAAWLRGIPGRTVAAIQLAMVHGDLSDSRALMAQAQASLGCAEHETSADGRFTLESVYCLGLCASSPAVQIGDRLHARMDPSKLQGLLAVAGGAQ